MARIRTIKPEHWGDKNLPKITLQAHLMWIALWNFSDDEGIFDADPLMIRSNIFPRRTDVRVEQVSQWLGQLVKARFIIPFEYKNEGYYIHRTFKAHQRIDKPQKSKIPLNCIPDTFQECSENDQRTISPVKEGKVKESKGEDSAPASVDPFMNPFSEKFLDDWARWKTFKKDQFKFIYKGAISEQAAANELVHLSGGNEDKARAIILQSISKGWKGFFELKNDFNGINKNQQGKQPTGADVDTRSAFDAIDRYYGKTGNT